MSPKTIRDIWNKVTWAKATRHLWSEDEEALSAADAQPPPSAAAAVEAEEPEPLSDASSSAAADSAAAAAAEPRRMDAGDADWDPRRRAAPVDAAVGEAARPGSPAVLEAADSFADRLPAVA